MIRTLVAAFALPTLACGQDLVWEHVGVSGVSKFEYLIANIGDIDQDGVEDLAATGYFFDYLRSPWQFYCLVIMSGRTGAIIRVQEVPTPHQGDFDRFEQITAAGDMNGDGFPDYATRVWNRGATQNLDVVSVWSGKDTTLIWSRTTPDSHWQGYRIAGGVDLNADGKPDLVVLSAREQVGGVLYAFDHLGRLIWRVQPPPGYGYAQSIAFGDDYDHDGTKDILLSCGGPGADGSLHVLSGRTGATLRIHDGTPLNIRLYSTVANCGDLDGDGVDDYAGAGMGYIGVFSGATGAFLQRIASPLAACPYPSGSYLGDSLAAGVDFDQDGKPDIIAGSSAERCQGVNVDPGCLLFSSRNWEYAYQIAGIWPSVGGPTQRYYGTGVLNGICFLKSKDPAIGPRFAYSETGYPAPIGSGYIGRIRCMTWTPRGFRTTGSGCVGAIGVQPRMGALDYAAHTPVLARLTLSATLPNSPCALLLGVSSTSWGGVPLPLDVSGFGFPGCFLRTSIDVVLPGVSGGVGPSSGFLSLDLPARFESIGTWRLNAQWLVLGRGSSPTGALSDSASFSLK